LRKEHNPFEEFWSKEFPITSMMKADFAVAGIPRTVVEQLSDDDMRQIASEMEDIYCEHGYWEDIRLAFEKVKGDIGRKSYCISSQLKL
jgi:hypothetical protein